MQLLANERSIRCEPHSTHQPQGDTDMSLERQMRRKAERNAEQLAAMQRLAHGQRHSLKSRPMMAFAPGQVTHACYSHDAHCKTLKTGQRF